MKKSLETYEPFTGHFTGVMSTFVSSSGKRYVFNKPLPRIERGRPYMAALDVNADYLRLIPVVLPDVSWGHRGRNV